MISVYEKLEIISKDFDNTTFKLIAKKILENIQAGFFYNQEELANQVFVSISTLTKFSKKLGFSGYREFMFTIKNEWKKYNFDKNIKLDTWEIFDSIQEWIMRNTDFIEELYENIKDSEIINIYSSYQSLESCKYFQTILAESGKNVIIKPNEFIYNSVPLTNRGINLLVLTGRDNDTLIENFLKLYNSKNKNFIIVTEKQESKIKLEFSSKMIIDYLMDNSQISIRTLAMNTLFFFIFNKL